MTNTKIIVVDMGAGRYWDDLIGHEYLNLEQNPLDNMYYGYVPPTDKIDITRIEKGAKDSVSDVLVVYVKAISKINKNREVIAFCENATVFKKPQSGKKVKRKFYDKKGKHNPSYSIISDNLTNLSDIHKKFR